MKKQTNILSRIILLVLLAILWGTKTQAKVYVLMTTDWEGREISEQNLQAFKDFRVKYPDMPILHFISAAYWSKANITNYEKKNINKKVATVIKPIDEIGLHFHSWKSLAENFNINFRYYPKFTAPNNDNYYNSMCGYADCGHEVALWAYDYNELSTLLNGSRNILLEEFSKPELSHIKVDNIISFRSGAWLTTNKVADVLVNNGFRLDSSEVQAKYLEQWGYPAKLQSWLQEYWPNSKDINTGPYILKQAQKNTLYELSDNACLADYMSANQMLNVFKLNANQSLYNPAQDYYVVMGFHLETAKQYIYRVERAIDMISSWARANDIEWEFLDKDKLGQMI